MFLPRSRPLDVREAALRGLRLSLNSPELSAGELPAGPARAGIAVHDGDDGGLALTIAVRSLGTGAMVSWSWTAALDETSLPRAVEAALSFAEGMGFLFDDDALAGGEDGEARHRALDAWWELAGWPAPPSEAAAEECEPASEGATAVASALGERIPLTKFRRRLGPPLPEKPAAPERGPALGRLRLVKRARDGEGRSPRWLRLLGSF